MPLDLSPGLFKEPKLPPKEWFIYSDEYAVQEINNARKNKKQAINGLIFINPPMFLSNLILFLCQASFSENLQKIHWEEGIAHNISVVTTFGAG
jgi:hypothetical protein